MRRGLLSKLLSKIRHILSQSWRYIFLYLQQYSGPGNQMLTRFSIYNKKPVIAVIVLLVLVWMIAQLNFGYSLDDLKQSGELVVISRESPTTWYEDSKGPAGPEYDYLESFAEFLGVDLYFDIRDNNQEVIDDVADGKGHIAAAGLIRHPALEKHGVVFGPEIQKVDQKVICRRNNGQLPRNLEELVDYELVVVAGSSYEASLMELQEEYDDLSWESVSDTNVDQLLEKVWRREIDCTVANSSALNIKRRTYPELQTAFVIEKDQSLAWMLSPEWTVLSDAIEDWLDYSERNGELLVLKDRHYIAEEFDYVDMRLFIRRIKSRLPKLKPIFEQAADKYELPWTLLAAQAYQESHWNRKAKSPTGVRGIMMLTQVTAKEMGVESRLDARQSIMGGAKYIKSMESRIPESVKGDDRWAYALTAYNIGMGHLLDARTLTRELGLDPDKWQDFKGVLPLLEQKKYYKNLKYGFSRGSEPVVYVQRIRSYENILRAQLAKSRGVHGA